MPIPFESRWRKCLNFLLEWIGPFRYFPTYLNAAAKQWTQILMGESVLAVLFIIWWAKGNPPLSIIFAAAVLLASFFVWYAEFVKSIPKFTVTEYAFRRAPATFVPMTQPVGPVTRMNFPGPATVVSGARVYIQILPKCITAAPVLRCRAHLIRTFRKTPESQWVETAINEAASLKWSLCDDTEITLEPGAEHRLNVCYASINSQLLPNITDTLPARAAHDFTMPSTFSFDVKIAADNCPPVYICLEVSSQAEWDKPSCIVHQGLTMEQAKQKLSQPS